MEYVIAAVFLVVSTVGAVILNLIADELRDWAPSLARWLIDCATLRLPEHERERYQEEWYSHLDECPGKLSKLWHATGCYLGAHVIAREHSQPASLRTNKSPSSGHDKLHQEEKAKHYRNYLSIGFLVAIALGIVLNVSGDKIKNFRADWGYDFGGGGSNWDAVGRRWDNYYATGWDNYVARVN